jgi:hypothetical protein
MSHRVILAGLCMVAFPTWAGADDVMPGLWELSLEATVDAAPGFAPGPTTVNQCFSKADARDPGKILAAVTTPDAGDCTYLERSYAGEMFHFKMRCTGALQMQSSGEVRFSATKLDGTIKTSSTIDGVPVEFKSMIRGRRIGDC